MDEQTEGWVGEQGLPSLAPCLVGLYMYPHLSAVQKPLEGICVYPAWSTGGLDPSQVAPRGGDTGSLACALVI